MLPLVLLSSLLVCLRQISGKFVTQEDLHCDGKQCQAKVEVKDYILIERGVNFGVQLSRPPHDPLCHPSFNVCHNYSGITFLRISGTFNKRDVTHLVFSSGNMRASLLIHRTGEDFPQRQRRIPYTTPHMLSVGADYKISQPVQVTLPFFSTNELQCAAYFGPDKLDDVISMESNNKVGGEGVQVKVTGSRSAIKIYGTVVEMPFTIDFFGEDPGTLFSFAFLSAHSKKFSTLLTSLSLIVTISLPRL